MNESGKTVAFVISAALLCAAAGSAHWLTKPGEVTGFERVGQEFFPEFDDAYAAKSLEVTAYDVESDMLRNFTVAYKDGKWRIPSHHDYPAEAAERLAATATSLIGLKRESIAGRRESHHERYGVVDPANAEADPEFYGQRITLRDDQGEILADFVIGKPAGSVADDSDSYVREIDRQDDFYFVRVPGEKETYKTRIHVDLSTRFSDWIEPDLLKVDATGINRLEIDNYEIVEEEVVVQGQRQIQVSKKTIDRHLLTRQEDAAWQLDGINETTEELVTTEIDKLLELLDSMTIAGVRPKAKLGDEFLVKSDLSINEELRQRNEMLFYSVLQQDVESKGFLLGAMQGDQSKLAMVATKGELRATTSDGVKYTLYFGRAVTGDQKEIEIGFANQNSEGESGDGESVQTETGDPEPETSEEESTGENRSRYVAVRVDYDPDAIGAPPVKPVEPAEPVKPEGYDEWRQEQDKKLEEQNRESPPDENQVDENASGNNASESDDVESLNQGQTGDGDDSVVQESDHDAAPTPPDDIAKASDDDYEKYEQIVKDYEQAKIQYSTDLESFEVEEEAYKSREKRGKDLVAELNDRFAEWFYVVPAESLARIKLSRGDLVSIRETSPPGLVPPISPQDALLPTAPDINFPTRQDSSEGKDEKPAAHDAVDPIPQRDEEDQESESDKADETDDGNA